MAMAWRPHGSHGPCATPRCAPSPSASAPLSSSLPLLPRPQAATEVQRSSNGFRAGGGDAGKKKTFKKGDYNIYNATMNMSKCSVFYSPFENRNGNLVDGKKDWSKTWGTTPVLSLPHWHPERSKKTTPRTSQQQRRGPTKHLETCGTNSIVMRNHIQTRRRDDATTRRRDDATSLFWIVGWILIHLSSHFWYFLLLRPCHPPKQNDLGPRSCGFLRFPESWERPQTHKALQVGIQKSQLKLRAALAACFCLALARADLRCIPLNSVVSVWFATNFQVSYADFTERQKMSRILSTWITTKNWFYVWNWPIPSNIPSTSNIPSNLFFYFTQLAYFGHHSHDWCSGWNPRFF